MHGDGQNSPRGAWGSVVLMFFGGRKRRAREAVAKRMADHETMVRYATQSLGSALSELRTSKIVAPMVLIITVLFYVGAFSSGNQVGWRLDGWVEGGRAGGPLWFVLLVTVGCGTLLLLAVIGGIRANLRSVALAEKRLDDLIAQGAADAAALEKED